MLTVKGGGKCKSGGDCSQAPDELDWGLDLSLKENAFLGRPWVPSADQTGQLGTDFQVGWLKHGPLS